jgi:hypothetical protein
LNSQVTLNDQFQVKKAEWNDGLLACTEVAGADVFTVGCMRVKTRKSTGTPKNQEPGINIGIPGISGI